MDLDDMLPTKPAPTTEAKGVYNEQERSGDRDLFEVCVTELYYSLQGWRNILIPYTHIYMYYYYYYYYYYNCSCCCWFFKKIFPISPPSLPFTSLGSWSNLLLQCIQHFNAVNISYQFWQCWLRNDARWQCSCLVCMCFGVGGRKVFMALISNFSSIRYISL